MGMQSAKPRLYRIKDMVGAANFNTKRKAGGRERDRDSERENE